MPKSRESFNNLLTLTASERSEMLRKNQVVDISTGFPAKDAKDFFQLMLELALNDVDRIPIIGVREDENTKVYALFRAHDLIIVSSFPYKVFNLKIFSLRLL